MAFSYIKLHACFTIDKIFIFQRKMVRYLYTDLTVNELFTCSDQVIPSLSSAKAYVQQCSNKIIRLYLSLSIVYMQEVAVWWSVHTRRNFFFFVKQGGCFFFFDKERGWFMWSVPKHNRKKELGRWAEERVLLGRMLGHATVAAQIRGYKICVRRAMRSLFASSHTHTHVSFQNSKWML